jgi:hypothetical protein
MSLNTRNNVDDEIDTLVKKEIDNINDISLNDDSLNDSNKTKGLSTTFIIIIIVGIIVLLMISSILIYFLSYTESGDGEIDQLTETTPQTPPDAYSDLVSKISADIVSQNQTNMAPPPMYTTNPYIVPQYLPQPPPMSPIYQVPRYF